MPSSYFLLLIHSDDPNQEEKCSLMVLQVSDIRFLCGDFRSPNGGMSVEMSDYGMKPTR